MQSQINSSESAYAHPRRWPRLSLNVPLRVIAPKDDKVMIIEGRGRELNPGGMAVFAGLELRIDELVDVEFTPPYSGDPIRARAVVRNRKGYTYGVEFITETEHDRETVAHIRYVLQPMGSPIQ